MEIEEQNELFAKSCDKQERDYTDALVNRPKMQRRKSQDNIDRAIEIMRKANYDPSFETKFLDDAIKLLEECE